MHGRVRLVRHVTMVMVVTVEGLVTSLLFVTSVTALRPRDAAPGHGAATRIEPAQLGDDEMEQAERQFYLNLIKQKILWYVDRPAAFQTQGIPSSRAELPEPVLEPEEPTPPPQTQEETDNILLTQSVSWCRTSRNQTAICASFHVNMSTHDISEVVSCDLHLNRTHWGQHRLKVTFVDRRPGIAKTRRAGRSKRVIAASGWVTLDMRTIWENAMSPNQNEMHLQMLCTSCDESTLQEVYGQMLDQPNQRPYLALLSRSAPAISRTKRDVSAVANNRCQMKPLRVNFHRDLNLTYIMQPVYYDANYCKGQCGLPGQEFEGTEYDSTMRRFMRLPAGRHLALIKRDCCVSTTTSITILAQVENNQLRRIRIPDMATDHCRCRH